MGRVRKQKTSFGKNKQVDKINDDFKTISKHWAIAEVVQKN